MCFRRRCQAYVDQVGAELSSVDVLVNSRITQGHAHMLEWPKRLWKSDSSTWQVLSMTQAVLKQMIKAREVRLSCRVVGLMGNMVGQQRSLQNEVCPVFTKSVAREVAIMRVTLLRRRVRYDCCLSDQGQGSDIGPNPNDFGQAGALSQMLQWFLAGQDCLTGQGFSLLMKAVSM